MSMALGLKAFKTARMDNLKKLREIAEDAWARSGIQEEVGRVSLCDIPSMMRQYDDAHRQEIALWHESTRAADSR